jgi:hypothetical protein
MSFHIDEFIDLSPKSVLLTNPVSPRDTHLLPVRGSMKPQYPPLINFLKASEIRLDRFDLLLKKALNIYTGTNNWCFWDFGDKNQLQILGENTSWESVKFDKPPSRIGLQVNPAGQPTFYFIKS